MRINRYYLLFALAFLLLAAAFLVYRWRERQLFSSVWAFIPQSAVVVVESAHPAEDLRNWQTSPPGQTVSTLPYTQQLLTRLAALEGVGPEVREWLRATPVVSSLHVTSPDDFDYLFYLPLPTGQDKELFGKVIEHFSRQRGYRTDSRNFGGFLIREITHTPSATRFSYLLHEKILVASYSPFLVEDVVRTLNETSNLAPNPWIARHKGYSGGEDGPRLYLSPAALPRLVQVFASATLDGETGDLAHLAHSVRMNVKTAPEGFFLGGEGKLTGGKDAFDYLAAFRGQSPGPPGCLHLVPARTAVFRRWAFGDTGQWTRLLSQYWAQHEPLTPVVRQAIAERYGVNPGAFLDLLGNEIALVNPESPDSPSEKLLIVRMARPPEFLSLLTGLADSLDAKEGIRPYREKLNKIQIRQLHLNEFPAALLGNAFRGFPQCFYAPVDDYLLFAGSLPALRQQLADVQAGNTWKNAPPPAVRTGLFDDGAAFSCYVDVVQAWPLFLQNASPHWQRLLLSHAATVQQFDWLLLQVRDVTENAFSVNARLHFGADSAQSAVRNKYFVNYQSSADTTLRIAPAIVRNHVDRSLEVLVQDAANRLYLMGANGKVLWRKWMEKPVAGEVYQVDYLKNNKLQYLFTTERNLYLLDRNGNPVGNFPVRVPAPAALQTAAVFDYDNTLDYRFLAQDLVGNLFLYDKAGKLLEGWNPLRLGYRLAGPVRHLRIRDKDYLIALRLDGKVYVLNRKGKEYPGFPLALSQSANPLYVERGTDAANTYLTSLSNTGEIVRFNLEGHIADRKQLYRPDKNTRFRLCVDQTRQGSWLVVRRDAHHLSVLDKKGNLLFTKEADAQGKYQVQYYDFGAGLRIVSLADLTQNQLRLFDLAGNEVGDKELHSAFPASIIYSNHFNKLLVYTGKGRQVEVTSMKVR